MKRQETAGLYTLQGTNISICQSFLKMFFLFRRMGFLDNICKCPIPNWWLYHVQLASWSWPKMVSSASITGCIWVLELGSVTFQRIQVSKILPDPTTKTFVLTSKTPNKNIPHQPLTPPNQKKNSITHPRGAWQKTPGLWSKILDSLDLELPRQTKRGEFSEATDETTETPRCKRQVINPSRPPEIGKNSILSNEKKHPWCFLGYFGGWNPTQVYGDCYKPLKGSRH